MAKKNQESALSGKMASQWLPASSFHDLRDAKTLLLTIDPVDRRLGYYHIGLLFLSAKEGESVVRGNFPGTNVEGECSSSQNIWPRLPKQNPILGSEVNFEASHRLACKRSYSHADQ